MTGYRNKISEHYFYFVFSVWFGTEILFNTTIKEVFGYSLAELNDGMAIVVLIMLAVQIVIIQDYSLKELMVVAPISLVIAYATLNANHKALISMWLFVIAAKYIDVDRVARIAYTLLLTIIAIVLWLYYTGKIDDFTIRRGNMIRHSLGFSHPNQLGLRIFQLVLCRMFIRRNRLNWMDYLITLFLGGFVYFVPNSQASFYSMIILLIMIIIYQISWDKVRGKEVISRALLFIIMLTNFGSMVLSLIDVKRVPILRTFDRILSYRFSQCYRTYKYYGMSLVGTDIQTILAKPVIGRYYHFWLDNAYMAILLRYGVIVYFLFSAIYFMTAIKLKRTNQYFSLFVYALFSIYGIMEYNFFALAHNMFLLAIASLLFNRQVIADKEPRKRYVIKFSM